ncbi:hypothetical protein ANSO36C_00080 [Nostoc cf. commune SO-36]|uniref:Uncharacterized protein n=1 Tax=Nostoc cf. commune SO-36 TaxID=449208 RepID=A0ABM7YUA4_NOSCO|nr:hypothetical protein [Nostoc commune]BDI14206.1 hypothetical protein ANSO36C_00080 [Nostoc cf. commune SO-36]
MSNTDLERLLYTVKADFQTEAANIAALAFPQTEFRLLARIIGSTHAGLVLPKNQFKLLPSKIGNYNLTINFKSQNHALENFQVNFFPKINTLTLLAYYKDGTANLRYQPDNNYNWFNARGYEITRPDSIGEKFELLAREFYPFFEEFFLEQLNHS